MVFQSINNISKDQIREFDCGIEVLNDHLVRYALQNNKKNISRTFVLEDECKIVGYFTLANAQISFEQLDEMYQKRLPHYPIPAIRIARLAVDSRFKGRRLGGFILREALNRIVDISKMTGICFVIVDAKETSKGFYEHYGFIKLSGKELTYILPLSTLKKAL